MPRQAHGRPLQAAGNIRPAKRRAPKSQGLNALEIAEREHPEQIKIRPHRLGEVEDDDSDGDHNPADANERTSKRRKIDNEGDEEQEEGGSDLDGNQWHVGVEEDDEDSDIDSDEAFGESDEERFADFAFRGSENQHSRPAKPGRAVRNGKINLSEGITESDADDDDDDVENDDDLGDEAVDLATALDMNEEADQEEADERVKKSNHKNRSTDTESSDSDDVEDEESDLSVSDGEQGDHVRLQNFVENLGAASSKETTSHSRVDPRSLPTKPSQFGLGTSKISVADLLQYVKDPQQRQSLKILQSSERNGAETYRGGIPGKLAPPLAKRQQDRLDRVAAYDESKKELAKWTDTIKRNRRAEHISFPLADPSAMSASSTQQFTPLSQSQPITSLDSKIKEIMEESGMLAKDGQSMEEQEQAYEELQENKMSLEEVQARRSELRKSRDLMFREEIRARRLKKIKSKAYRRVHRKERDKAKLEERVLLAATGLVDSEEERERDDRRRAEERMGARHRESKWAKSVKITGRAAWDEDARHGVTDLARRDEELRRRIEGKTARESDDLAQDSDSDSGSSRDGFDDLSDKLDGLETAESDLPQTGLGSMAFMQKAEAARKAANDAEILNIKRSMRGDVEEQDHEPSSIGRQKFGQTNEVRRPPPSPAMQRSEFEEHMSDDELAVGDAQQKEAGASVQPLSTAKKPLPRRRSQKNRDDSQRPVAEKEQRIRITAPVQQQEVNGFKPPPAGREQTLGDYSSASDSEESTFRGDNRDGPRTLTEAVFFGPDDVVKDFAKEKQETVVEEGDQIIDNALPGWGSWTGDGISKREQKRGKGRFLTTTKGVAPEKRQDARLERVIVNEKRVKKNGKYLATELPHPFESRQQYERSLRLPLGPEWTTKSTFQDATKPRVLLKQGIIRPMSRPLA